MTENGFQLHRERSLREMLARPDNERHARAADEFANPSGSVSAHDGKESLPPRPLSAAAGAPDDFEDRHRPAELE